MTRVMRRLIIPASALFLCMSAISAPAATPVYEDDFATPSAAGSIDPARGNGTWGPVTLFGKGSSRAESGDRFAIGQNALSITDARMTAKGPASLALLREFSDDAGPFLISVTVRPGNTAWTGIKWGPRRLGNWPDLSHGVAVSITSGGRWTVWANDKKMKNVIGGGQIVPADSYRIHIGITEPDAEGKGTRRLTLSVNDTLVLSDKIIDYPWNRHHLVLQALGKAGTPGTATIDDLSIEKLDENNSPATTAKATAANLNATGIWIEAEDAIATNFHSGKVIDAHPNGPSGALFLRVQTRKDQPNVPGPPYYARYKFTIPPASAAARSAPPAAWHLWLASTPQNAGWASPLAWRVEGGETHALKGSRWAGATYGNPRSKDFGWVFGWVHAGTLDNLTPGEHELEILVTDPRGDGSQYVACLDSLLLTNDPSFVPSGPRPKYSTQSTFAELVAAAGGTERDLVEKLNHRMYYELIGNTREQVSQETADYVLAKIANRPLPGPEDRAPDVTEFGLHGMEKPFVVVGRNAETPEVTRAYELLARAGVDSFRSAEACWHRIHDRSTDNGNKADTHALHLDFTDLDFQVASAQRYGMTHLFTVGYPPDSLTLARNNKLAACDPRHYGLYREYLDVLLRRYKGKGVRYVELANEVDAPSVWWRGPSTPAHYVAEMKILREAVDAVKPVPDEMKTVAFAATYSRDNELGGPKGGRRFVTEAFNLGIDKYTDAYAVHYLSRLKEKDYHDYFRSEIARAGSPDKPLLNTEQDGQLYPYDGAKSFARVFFLYAMPRMDFFLARDFYEGGYLKPRGLFDIDWRPKLRLLTYAFSVDAMRGRELVGIAQPEPGVEAYVLKRPAGYKGKPATPGTDTLYSIVLWKNDREVRELPADAEIQPADVTGMRSVRAAMNWNLDPIACDSAAPVFSIGDAPIAIYTDELPSWKLLSREQYLASFEAGKTSAPLPGSVE